MEEHFGAIQNLEVDRRLAGGLRPGQGSDQLTGDWALKLANVKLAATGVRATQTPAVISAVLDLLGAIQ